MTGEQLRISYRDVAAEAAIAVEAWLNDARNIPGLTLGPKVSALPDALRALAGLVAEVEKLPRQLGVLSTQDGIAALMSGRDVLNSIAAGFDPSIALQPGGPTG